MKKVWKVVVILIILFIIFLYIYLKEHNYKMDYSIDKVKVTEEYHKKNKYYRFLFKYKNKEYEVISLSKYTNKRKLINKISIKENDNTTCLELESKYVDVFSLCSEDNNYYISNINKIDNFKENNNFENIKIDSLENNIYLLWNYHSFIYLSPKKNEVINLFAKDIYSLNLIYQHENYLVLPDYNQDYKFDKLYFINPKNAKIKDIKLRYELYFNSYFLGDYKNKIYLYDIKNEQEYYIDLKKNDIYKTGYKLLINGHWEKTTNQKLKNSQKVFENEKIFSYFLENNKLMGQMIDSDKKILMSNRNISKIVKTNNFDVYYISDDILYYYNPLKGEKALLKYSEWQFNSQNMIFIF